MNSLLTDSRASQLHLPDIVGQGYGTFWRFKGRYRVCKGSRASKKSKTTALWYIVNLMKYPQANLLVIRKVYRTLHDSCFTDLKYGSFNSGGEALAVDATLKVSGAAADAKATGDALAGKAAASHTHNYAGSSSAGGAANSANKLNTNAGSATQGVYFKDGVPVAMTYTLGKSVPADAKFTDTNTWRGVQDNLTSTATDQSLSANQGKVLKGLLDGKAASSHTHDDRYYTESEMNTKLNGKANSSHTHNYAGSSSAGGTANSVNGLTFAAQTTDPGAGSALTTNKVLIVYV